MSIFGFLIYRNPMMAKFAFIEYGFSTSVSAVSILGTFRYLGYYYDNQFKVWDEKNKKVNSQIQDIKMQLLT